MAWDSKTNKLAEDVSSAVMKKNRGRLCGDYGLCNRCINLGFRITTLGTEHVWCVVFDNAQRQAANRGPQPDVNDPIRDCTHFMQIGERSFQQLADMALVLSLEERTSGGGFGQELKKEVVCVWKDPMGVEIERKK